MLSLHGLLLGWKTRLSALAAWLLFLAFKTAGTASAYGAFEFAQIGLFYCFVLPVGACWSLDSPREAIPTAGSRLSLRIIQLHLCTVYLASGLEKAAGIQWWNGEAIWRCVMRPTVAFNFAWLASAPLLAMVAGWSVVVLETGYAVLRVACMKPIAIPESVRMIGPPLSPLNQSMVTSSFCSPLIGY